MLCRVQNILNFQKIKNVLNIQKIQNCQKIQKIQNIANCQTILNIHYILIMGGDLIKYYVKWLCRGQGQLQFHTIPHPHSLFPHISPYFLISLSISPYSHLTSTILSISTVFSIFRHIPLLQINYYVYLTKA